MKKHFGLGKRGQAIFEYALLLAVVAAAVAGMQIFAKRGIQAAVKMTADGMSPELNDPGGEEAQFLGIRYESRDRQNEVFSSGMVLDKQSSTQSVSDQHVKMETKIDGRVETTIPLQGDTTATTGALANLGAGVSDYVEVVITPKQEPPGVRPVPPDVPKLEVPCPAIVVQRPGTGPGGFGDGFDVVVPKRNPDGSCPS